MTSVAVRYAETLEDFERSLSSNPEQPDILVQRGNLLHALNRSEQAVESFDRALALRPDNAEALHNRGVAFYALKKFGDALESYDRALVFLAENPIALNNRAAALAELERFEEALATYDKAVALRPDYAEAHYNRGKVLKGLSRLEEALASYDRAIELRPADAQVHYNRANLLHEMRRFAEALVGYDRAVALQPAGAETLNNRGHALHQLKRYDDALTNYRQALTLRPEYPEARVNRGNTLHALGRFDEALASYDGALSTEPENADGLYGRSNALYELKRYEEALADYDRALAVRPQFAEAVINRGLTLKELKRFPEALASYRQAQELEPNWADPHWNEALLRLLTADFDRGWAKYEWRWHRNEMSAGRRRFAQPLWLGEEDIDGKTILIHSEQGLGDTLQFCRYVPLVAARGARVIFEVQAPLAGLMRELAGADLVVERGNTLPSFDVHCPLLSLPLAFSTQLETIPSDTLYLRAPADYSAKWSARLESLKGPRIGLVWSGNPKHENDRNRSLALRALAPLFDVPATFISLQKELRNGDAELLSEAGIVHFGDELSDFRDTAALISGLDLVISVDTSVAHLAGALGKPVWILVTHIPDWRWLLERDDTPWYRSARLFRQGEDRSWAPVVQNVREHLISGEVFSPSLA